MAEKLTDEERQILAEAEAASDEELASLKPEQRQKLKALYQRSQGPSTEPPLSKDEQPGGLLDPQAAIRARERNPVSYEKMGLVPGGETSMLEKGLDVGLKALRLVGSPAEAIGQAVGAAAPKLVESGGVATPEVVESAFGAAGRTFASAAAPFFGNKSTETYSQEILRKAREGEEVSKSERLGYLTSSIVETALPVAPGVGQLGKEVRAIRGAQASKARLSEEFARIQREADEFAAEVAKIHVERPPSIVDEVGQEIVPDSQAVSGAMMEAYSVPKRSAAEKEADLLMEQAASRAEAKALKTGKKISETTIARMEQAEAKLTAAGFPENQIPEIANRVKLGKITPEQVDDIIKARTSVKEAEAALLKSGFGKNQVAETLEKLKSGEISQEKITDMILSRKTKEAFAKVGTREERAIASAREAVPPPPTPDQIATRITDDTVKYTVNPAARTVEKTVEDALPKGVVGDTVPVTPSIADAAVVAKATASPEQAAKLLSSSDTWVTSIESALQRTETGKVISRMFRKYTGVFGKEQAKNQRIYERLKTLLPTQADNAMATRIMHGLEKIESASANVKEAVMLTRGELKRIFEEVKAAGIEVNEMPDYFPLHYRGDLADLISKKDAQTIDALARNFAKEGGDINAAKRLLGMSGRLGKERQDILQGIVQGGAAKNMDEAAEWWQNSTPLQRLWAMRTAAGEQLGRVSDFERSIINDVFRYRERISHNLETSRTLDIRELADMDNFAWYMRRYADGASERRLQALMFGKEDEIINGMANKWSVEVGGGRGSSEFIEGVLDLQLRRKFADSGDFLRKFRQWSVATQLPMSFTSQLKGLTTTASVAGKFRTLAAIPNAAYGTLKETFRRAARSGDADLVELSGLLVDHWSPSMLMERTAAVDKLVRGNTVLGLVKKVTDPERISRVTNFATRLTDRFGKEVAVLAGAGKAKQMLRDVIKGGKGAAFNRKILADTGIDVEAAIARGSLTHDDMVLAGRWFAVRTQSRGDILDLPLGWQVGEGAKTMLQYKGVTFNMTRTYKQFFWEQLKTGRKSEALNVGVTALVGAASINQTLDWARRKMMGSPDDKNQVEQFVELLAIQNTEIVFADAAKAALSGKPGQAGFAVSREFLPAAAGVLGAGVQLGSSLLLGAGTGLSKEAQKEIGKAFGKILPPLRLAGIGRPEK